ncbi:hypothetical protein DERP_012821 [Dermatophagoides pteronyssinus]|uniref:Uncharacterized protein n=1 Tax=Dermatophagoides pteronyssinus TaxID=6956 RepID=A0ABQ8JFP2_DERPT|nr:hypothetical protein DERP_012821 [Dermatophagoides pteronyssinus]
MTFNLFAQSRIQRFKPYGVMLGIAIVAIEIELNMMPDVQMIMIMMMIFTLNIWHVSQSFNEISSLSERSDDDDDRLDRHFVVVVVRPYP